MPEELWPIVMAQVEQAAAHWRAPDRGIWEVRGEPQHFTASKIMCWVALDRGVRLARLHDSHATADKWQAIADEIHADILANGVDDRGVLVQRYGDDALDASLLLAPLVRFLPPDDPRIRATVLAIADELTHEGLVLRYRVEETDDGLAGEEGTFTICSFWLVSALVEIGELDRAQALCERLLSHASAAAALRRGTGPGLRPAPRQLPAGLHPPGTDQRRHPRHPGAGPGSGARVQSRQPAELIEPTGRTGFGQPAQLIEPPLATSTRRIILRRGSTSPSADLHGGFGTGGTEVDTLSRARPGVTASSIDPGGGQADAG